MDISNVSYFHTSFLTGGYNTMWLSAIRTHWLPPLLVFNIAKRLLPGLPVTNEKLSSNSLSKNSQTQQKFAKYLEMAESLQKHYFFHWTSVVQRSFIFRFVFYQNVYRFSTFWKFFQIISFNILQTHCIWYEVFNIMLLLSKLSHFHLMQFIFKSSASLKIANIRENM